MLYVLHKEGFSISARALQNIRLQIGLRRRINVENIDEVEVILKEIVQKELDKGSIEGYGRGHLYTRFRSQMHIVSR
jgi:hypothetical protein